MRLVVKIDVVWKPVNLNPGNGLARRLAVADLQQIGALRFHAGVAVHARLALFTV